MQKEKWPSEVTWKSWTEIWQWFRHQHFGQYPLSEGFCGFLLHSVQYHAEAASCSTAYQMNQRYWTIRDMVERAVRGGVWWQSSALPGLNAHVCGLSSNIQARNSIYSVHKANHRNNGLLKCLWCLFVTLGLRPQLVTPAISQHQQHVPDSGHKSTLATNPEHNIQIIRTSHKSTVRTTGYQHHSQVHNTNYRTSTPATSPQ